MKATVAEPKVADRPSLWGAKRVLKAIFVAMRPHRFGPRVAFTRGNRGNSGVPAYKSG